MRDLTPSGLPFMKMHGLGNDFVVIDRRRTCYAIASDLVRTLGDRHRGIGFDQLVLLDLASEAAANLTFYNPDGSMSAACGNATRCIAHYLMAETNTTSLVLKTERGLLPCARADDGLTSVNMGAPMMRWDQIPLSHEMDSLHLPLDGDPVGTGFGNPHCTFFVEDAEAADLEAVGPQVEHDLLFPQRTNVQVAHLLAPNHLRMRVWERGTGITLASGSSSCAAAVAAHRRGLTGRQVHITLDGGPIYIDWRDDGVWMTGPTAHVFDGVLSPALLEAL